MRRVGSWVVAAALIVGLGAAVAAADDADGDAKAASAKSGWWSGWFGDKPKAKTEKKSAVEDAPAVPSGVQMAVAEQQRQMNAALRRMQVCERLRQVAVQTGNADLERQANEMDARAWEVYRHQTAHLPVPAKPSEAVKVADKEQAAKRPNAARVSTDKDAYEPPPEVKRTPPPIGTLQSMDGNFDQRERNAVNGTFIGRDKQ